MKWVGLEAEGEGIRVLTMNRPPVNALGRELVADLGQALADLRHDAEARCLVLCSGGSHFSAGADLKERQAMTLDEVRAFVPRLAAMCNGVAAIPYPTIAAVRGAAAGGGCELALACDFRLLAEDAKIGLREVALAIIPGAGGTQRLPRLIGPSKAKRWILTAQMHSAAQALADGVADRVVPASALHEEARRLARTIAGNGPLAVRLAKRSVERGMDRPLDEGLALEWDCYQQTLGTEDRVEALRAFAEKRPPRFRGS